MLTSCKLIHFFVSGPKSSLTHAHIYIYTYMVVVMLQGCGLTQWRQQGLDRLFIMWVLTVRRYLYFSLLMWSSCLLGLHWQLCKLCRQGSLLPTYLPTGFHIHSLVSTWLLKLPDFHALFHTAWIFTHSGKLPRNFGDRFIFYARK